MTTNGVPESSVRGSLRVVLVDDHAVVRRGLAELLASTPDIEVVGTAGDGDGRVRPGGGATSAGSVIGEGWSQPRTRGPRSKAYDRPARAMTSATSAAVQRRMRRPEGATEWRTSPPPI